MILLLIVLLAVIFKMQLYPLLKQGDKKDVFIYILLYLGASVLLILISKDINGVNLL